MQARFYCWLIQPPVQNKRAYFQSQGHSVQPALFTIDWPTLGLPPSLLIVE